MDSKFLLNTSLDKIIKKYPFVEDYLKDNLIEIDLNKSVKDVIDNLQEDEIEEKGLSKDKFLDNLVVFVEQMIELLNLDESKIEKMVILPGINKLGEKENFDKLVISKGDIIAIVGPTGSGKSRLLADIEWGAQGDTPTKREILINGKVMSRRERFSAENKLVAQLSQNMNFVMDLTVFEFLELHAKSRMIENEKEIIDKIFTKANELAGEKFKLDTPVTSLSGGQSRALMTADTAILSRSPIVLIDEIENAGIDRKKALDLLVGEEKIVLMATHDPLLALMGNKRVIIQNGGIYKVMDITEDERKILKDLEKLDNIIQSTRNKLRYGQKLDLDLEKELQK